MKELNGILHDMQHLYSDIEKKLSKKQEAIYQNIYSRISETEEE